MIRNPIFGRLALVTLMTALVVACGPGQRDEDRGIGDASPNDQLEVPADGQDQPGSKPEGPPSTDPLVQEPAVPGATTEFDVEKRTILERDTIAIFELKVAQLGSTLIVAEFSQDQYIAEIVGVEPKNASGISTAAAVERLKAEFVIGSGFVESFIPPVPSGLLVINNATLSAVNEQGFSTLVAVAQGQVELLPRDQWADESISGAFQVGPRLVEDGAAVVLDLKRGPATRAFVGLRVDNSVVAGVTLDNVDLQVLADFLAAQAASGGLATVDAVNLAGGGSEALMYSKDDNQIAYGNVKSRQASLLAFRRKPESVAKRSIAAAVAARAGIGQEDSTRCIDAMLSVITNSLSASRSVNVSDFGTFSVKERAARTGRNPRTGESIEIEASRVPGFRSSRALTDRLNTDADGNEQEAPATIELGSELAAEVASRAGLTVTTTRQCTSAFFEEVADVLARGNNVPLVGFGTFSVKTRAERMGRNPQTGEQIFIPASNVVGFKAGKALKDAVN